MKTTGLIIAAISFFSISAAHAFEGVSDPDMMASLKAKYPRTNFKSVTTTPLPGVFEVVMGKNVAYVESSGRYFLFGHLFDMHTQTDMTEGKLPAPAAKAASASLDFKSLPLQDTIVSVKGDGSRKIVVFSDPDCPYCKQLENTLATMKNITVHTFMMPLQQLHPQARAKSIGVWCASDRGRAWDDLMRKNIVAQGSCEHPVDRNIALAERLGINGTPTIILEDGTMLPGAPSAAKLEQLLVNAANSASKVADK